MTRSRRQGKTIEPAQRVRGKAWEEPMPECYGLGGKGKDRLGFTAGRGVYDFSSRAVRIDRDPGQSRAQPKPYCFPLDVALEGSVEMSAGPHESRNNRGYGNAGSFQLCAQSFGEAQSRELGRSVREKMWNRYLTTNRGDIHDTAALFPQQVREHG